MASGDLRDELNCSICLNLYTDPVSLRCGHNFCRLCIAHVLDTQDGSRGYLCPDCRAAYPKRPVLEKNRKLGNIVEHFLSTQPDLEETRIFCTYCTKAPVPAVKSCLHCEISLCDEHLTAHNKTLDHVLTESTRSFGNKKCPIHKKVLELYCPQDASCLCVFCCLVGEHRGHQVDLLDEASEKKKKKLRKYLDELNLQKVNIQTRVQNLHDHQRNIHERTSFKRKNMCELFMDIKKQLEMAEKKVLSEISRQEEKIVSQISDLIKKLEIKEVELSRQMCNLEEMCNVTDPIRLLQESDITVCGHGDGEITQKDDRKIKSEEDSEVCVYDTKVQDNRTDQNNVLQESGQEASHSDKSIVTEEAAPVLDLGETADDLDEVLISMTLHRSMRDIVTNVTLQLGFQVPDISLDVDTANNEVKISENLKMAKDSEKEMDRTESPGRFLIYSQVLSRCVLSSGRHYWEVEWNQIGECDIGMSYPSIKREGEESAIGYNDKSWSLNMNDGEYIALHNSFESNLKSESTCPTLGVFLDYEAGRLSFYELCDPIRHLYTFTASFTEPLHPAFYVYRGASLTIRS
ncbi:E3 ubiquitin/ISG15 ligase TRIM25-like [Hyla sarda]|uniref:E3 ubiquitin/ISG15 ligase TRIM25-like n=1 Tax=Hyla sarda TaxID=327740 RepID=UPI0024C3B0E4|nr:E3 ubiquitin/ISG15 ligase TRIM25-like [Hyla sarda]XP_056392470.1 E3 ubiquitin/ISG15 ligase TRIM25-like [Hyla sarda]XP_056392471.1 E3 ubiquitin/ISG15 ligase TRIM25-like [Hyla sarda]XP_056392472.1 E3 ubiquitin/ISG15 ligase TRIM25-like [Hyla sarda]